MFRKRLGLLVAFFLTLSFSGVVYAGTFDTATETIGIVEPTGDINTSNETGTQPDWDFVLDPIPDNEFFFPDSAGDETVIAEQYPDTGAHWDKVDDSSPDSDSTFITTQSSFWQEDLYNIQDHSTQTAAGPITSVKVYIICRSTVPATQNSAYIHIKTNGTEYNASSENVTMFYTPYSYQWDTNPQTGQAWTWDEIDALQIGAGLRSPDNVEYTRCTQVYAEVRFEAPPLTGNAPTGDLFTVTPNADYTGDLAVKVYIVNAGNLAKAFKSMDMHVYLEGSEEAGRTPNYRLLTLENGTASFWLDSAGSTDRALSITGGTYTLTSREPEEWQADWTVTPEFYCEVTQR